MKYLLDTCVLSELVKPAPSVSVLAWMKQQNAQNLYVSALSLAEMHRGVAKLAKSRRQQELREWLASVEQQFEDRALSFETATASVWGQLCAQMESKGKPMAQMDSLIAAVALSHGLCLVTRNERDFANAPLLLVNPWGKP